MSGQQSIDGEEAEEFFDALEYLDSEEFSEYSTFDGEAYCEASGKQQTH